jgi:hypothetical protein
MVDLLTKASPAEIAVVGAPWRKSKKTRIDADRALATPMPCGDFDRSEWEIMYPLFVEEGLVDPSKRVNREDV